jgi:adenine-specific DNA-methyltransferase
LIYGTRTNGGEHGTVFTRSEVVDFILTLSGLVEPNDFLTKNVLDPAVGEGVFVLSILRRILDMFQFNEENLVTAIGNITAVELDKAKCDVFIGNVKKMLISVDPKLERYWKHIKLINGDYLNSNTSSYDVIVGNPPYVRYDNIPFYQIDIYKRLYPCFKDRSDLYIAFFEKGIKSLNPGGVLTFICADRWLNNQYGRMLRKTIYNNFYFSDIIKIDQFSPFEEEVIAYPSIFSIRNETKGDTRYYSPKSIKDLVLEKYYKKCRVVDFDSHGNLVLTKESDELVSIEEQGFQIGIGVATGADKVFVVKKSEVSIEKERLVPLLTRKDIDGDKIIWTDRYVVNPYFKNTASLVDLRSYPCLEQYFLKHEFEIKKRHVSKNNTEKWYKTIDRITPLLINKPKLLIPDISTKNNIIFDEGRFYPHHNFYYIIGNAIEDLLALRAILSTDFVKRQVAEKGLLMNGGALRWQAQTLRKIRIPNILKMTAEEKQIIIDAYNCHDKSVLEIFIRQRAA